MSFDRFNRDGQPQTVLRWSCFRVLELICIKISNCGMSCEVCNLAFFQNGVSFSFFFVLFVSPLRFCLFLSSKTMNIRLPLVLRCMLYLFLSLGTDCCVSVCL